MGVKIGDLLVSTPLKFEDLYGKIVVVDTFVFLYQFLSTIRQADGSFLTDSKGRVTSHLIGLFSRTAQMLQKQIKPVFVFDGVAPELKKKERERRAALKEEARKEYEIAKQRKDFETMKKFAQRTTKLTGEMIDEAKKLIKALGCPIVEAPSEGEAQAAQIVKNGDAYAVATQDADSFLFGAPKIVKNLSFIGKKKRLNKLSYETISPELVNLNELLNVLGITQDQLIVLGILVGTDFNIGGIKGIGQKIALKLVKEYKDDYDALFEKVKWSEQFEISWKDIFNTIKNMPTTNNYKIEFESIDESAVYDLLVGEHDFSKERVDSTLEKLQKYQAKRTQKGLGDFF